MALSPPAFAKHLSLFLCVKYLCRKKIVLLSIAAVTMSSALIIVVASLFSGFIDAIGATVSDHSGDLVLTCPGGAKFPQYDQLIEEIEKSPNIESATAVLSGYGGLLYLGRGNVRAVKVVGIEMPKRSSVTPFAEFLLAQGGSEIPPSFEVPGSDKLGAFVGIGVLASPDEVTDEYDEEKLKAEFIGKTIGLTTVKGENQKTTFIKFPIADIFFSGYHRADSDTIYMPIEMLSGKLFAESDSHVADTIQIKTALSADTETAMKDVRLAWKTFAIEKLKMPHLASYASVETSSKQWAPLISEYRKQMNMLIVIFGIVSAGVVMLISCIFYLIVMTKQKDVAVAKSCGLSFGAVITLFVSFGFLIGSVGSGLGVSLAYFIIRNINFLERMISITLGLKLWKSSTYMFTRIPNQMNWGWAGCVFGIAILAAGLGALIPAIMAARIRPVEILRYE
jgi:lipoprotein-releasing system permease protein